MKDTDAVQLKNKMSASAKRKERGLEVHRGEELNVAFDEAEHFERFRFAVSMVQQLFPDDRECFCYWRNLASSNNN